MRIAGDRLRVHWRSELYNRVQFIWRAPIEYNMSGTGNRLKWILAGYKLFADHGPDGICVNEMARTVSLSRTSFYHHFGDVDEFIEVLLEHHEDRAREYHAGLMACRRYEPDLIELIIGHRDGFLFHRRLLVNRSVSKYAACAARIDQANAPHTFSLWSRKHGLEHLGDAARDIFVDLSESWWTRVGPDSFEYETLKRLDDEITGDLQHVLRSVREHGSFAIRPIPRIAAELAD